MLDRLEKRFRAAVPAVDFCSLRFVREENDTLTVRQDLPQPVQRSDDFGAMVTVVHGGGVGYAATSDLTATGLKSAIRRARRWAARMAGNAIADWRKVRLPDTRGEHVGPNRVPWSSANLGERFGLLRDPCRELKADARIVDWEASIWHQAKETLYLTAGGGRVYQQFSYILPSLRAVANQGSRTQVRSFGRLQERARQGGLEVLDDVGFRAQPPRIAREAVELLSAPNCPSGRMDVLLATDQMVLQIHESIGHPLELDRILGDERNFAGGSFVTPDMFGSYRYGSDLLNLAYDPTVPEEFATFAWDDEGSPAERKYLIHKGILQRPLGAAASQARAGADGVACCRAVSWNRPPIDRMGNLNLDAGESTLEDMISATRRGVYMKTNNCYSIDDRRNKFQFGCEWGQLIDDGRLTTVVRNPNYRGISATFWRNLKMVGDESTREVLGCSCGKGEPNQEPRVGHASPACLFADVEVLGGA